MSDLTLLLQTSNGVPVMGLATQGVLAFDSAQDDTLLGSRQYRHVLETGLARLERPLDAITNIFVDIGPGELGVTRTGVAFANALGFALGLPTVGIPAFELLGHEGQKQSDLPVVMMRKAAKPYVHFGHFEGGTLRHSEHCTLADAQKQIDALGAFTLVGNVPVNDEQLPLTNTATLGTMLEIALKLPPAPHHTRAYPIVDDVQ